MTTKDTEKRPIRLIVRIAQDVLRRQTFETLADLGDVVKARCARLKIPYDAGRITAALDELSRGRTRRLLTPASLAGPRPERADPAPIARAEAAAILRQLGVG